MISTVASVTGMGIYVVEDRIVSQWKLQCCRMVLTIYQRLVKLFRPIWQYHHLMIASIIVPIIKCFQCSLTGLDQFGKAHPRLDASLLQ
jgi:predicted membrane-bound mannosyltransferase